MTSESVFKHLVNQLKILSMRLKDNRSGGNLKFKVSDAVLSAFSIFYMQSPSFLSSQLELQRKRGDNNARTIFGIHKIPSNNQIRNILADKKYTG